MMSYLQVRRDATRSDKKVKFIAEQQTSFPICVSNKLNFRLSTESLTVILTSRLINLPGTARNFQMTGSIHRTITNFILLQSSSPSAYRIWTEAVVSIIGREISVHQ